MQRILVPVLFFLLTLNASSQSIKNYGRLRVTPDGHYLEYENGNPFFWLGDTGWQLFSRLTLSEIKFYLDNRASKGFNVIQVCILGEGDISKPNRYGQSPLIKNNPLQPNEKYFALVDSVVKLCLQKNLFLALMPTWGSTVVQAPGNTVIFDSVIAFRFGKWIAERYTSHAYFTHRRQWLSSRQPQRLGERSHSVGRSYFRRGRSCQASRIHHTRVRCDESTCRAPLRNPVPLRRGVPEIAARGRTQNQHVHDYLVMVRLGLSSLFFHTSW
jgi:hypothetical protein